MFHFRLACVMEAAGDPVPSQIESVTSWARNNIVTSLQRRGLVILRYSGIAFWLGAHLPNERIRRSSRRSWAAKLCLRNRCCYVKCFQPLQGAGWSHSFPSQLRTFKGGRANTAHGVVGDAAYRIAKGDICQKSCVVLCPLSCAFLLGMHVLHNLLIYRVLQHCHQSIWVCFLFNPYIELFNTDTVAWSIYSTTRYIIDIIIVLAWNHSMDLVMDFKP